MQRSIFVSIFILLLSSCATSAPTQTSTSQPALIEETPIRALVPSTATITPTPAPTITLTRQATRTPLPLETYYDAEFNITLGYPDTWEMVAPRHFEGEGGYLTIKELTGYHTYLLWHTCNDYAFMHGYPNTAVPYDPGCVITPSTTGQPVIFIFAYAVSENGPHYLVLETPIDYFTLIANSIKRDDAKNIYLSNNDPIPDPVEQKFSSSVSVRESYLDVAVYDWSTWNLHDISFANSIRGTGNWDSTSMAKLCGPEVFTEDGLYTFSENRNLLEVSREEAIVFSQEDPYPNYGIHNFCVWNGHWFLETSGYLFNDGEIVNHLLGYEDIHTWRILQERPFYFFVKDGKTWISLDGQALPISYDYVYHGDCCAIGAATNPIASSDTIWFYAVRDGAWYSVELKVTD